MKNDTSTYALDCRCMKCNKRFAVDSSELHGSKPDCPKCGSNTAIEILDVTKPITK